MRISPNTWLWLGNSLKNIIERIVGTKTDSLELTVDSAAPDKLTDFENKKIDPTNNIAKNIPNGIKSKEMDAFFSETNNNKLIIDAEK